MFHVEHCNTAQKMNISRREFLHVPLSLTAAAVCGTAALPALSAHSEKANPHPKDTGRAGYSPLADLYKTSPHNPSARRMEILGQIQKRADACEHLKFIAYCVSAILKEKLPDSAPEIMHDFEYAYETVAEKLAKNPHPQKGVRLYLLYNMGYIVQTPTAAFGIDIVHTQTKKIAKLLDFLLITHKHADHYSPLLVKQMNGKPVVSNFINNEFIQTSDKKEYNIGNIGIAATLTHHGGNIPKYNSTFEITCRDTPREIKILHIGDAGKWEQIKPSSQPDVFIPHVSVGLDIKKCAEETVKPKLLLMSHLLELGHPTYKWRHPLSLGLKKCAALKNTNAIMPFWGECIEIE